MRSIMASPFEAARPPAKLTSRFPMTLANLKAAIRALPTVWVFDNEDLRHPFRKVAVFADGRPVFLARRRPGWLTSIVK